MIAALWPRLKVWRQLTLGPVSLVFNFQRRTRITRGVCLLPTHDQTDHAAQHANGPASLALDAVPTALTAPNAAPQAGTAVIVGVGPGFGHALARRLAAAGFDLVLISRDAKRLAPLAEELHNHGHQIESMGGDATNESDVASLFEAINAKYGVPSLVVYSLQEFGPGETLEVTVPSFESAWRQNCLGPFLVSRAVGKAMKLNGKGTILLIGSTSSIIGRAGHLNLAVGKFGQRALAQVLARELWPSGVHVAHVMIDADICETGSCGQEYPQSDPDDIAQSVLAIHLQPRTAWSSEIDLRPWNERFWEHC